jgi:hypothetical protein
MVAIRTSMPSAASVQRRFHLVSIDQVRTEKEMETAAMTERLNEPPSTADFHWVENEENKELRSGYITN